jgi:transposase
VPKALLLRKLTEGMNINELAKYFDVSVPVIKNRLQWIKVN